MHHFKQFVLIEFWTINLMDMDIPQCTFFYGLQNFQKKSAQRNRINSDAFSDNEQSAKEYQKSIRNIRKFKNIFLKSIFLF